MCPPSCTGGTQSLDQDEQRATWTLSCCSWWRLNPLSCSARATSAPSVSVRISGCYWGQHINFFFFCSHPHFLPSFLSPAGQTTIPGKGEDRAVGENPYTAFVLVPVFFLLGLLGVVICHVLKKKGYRCTTEAQDDDEEVFEEEKDPELGGGKKRGGSSWCNSEWWRVGEISGMSRLGILWLTSCLLHLRNHCLCLYNIHHLYTAHTQSYCSSNILYHVSKFSLRTVKIWILHRNIRPQ